MKHVSPAELRRKNAGDRVGDHLELKSLMDALAKRDDEIKSFAAKAGEEIKTHGRILDETKSALEKITTEGASLRERMLTIEQKLATRAPGVLAEKSLGERFIEADDFKALQTKGRGIARLNLKATITSGPNELGESPAVAGGAGATIRPERLPGIVGPAERELTIRNLLLPGRTSSNAIEYVKEVGFTNAAATVAENPQAEKPESSLTFDLVTANVRTIAHMFTATRQVLSDAPMLASYIDGRARIGLKLVEETQLLTGDGNGQNLHGLIPNAIDFDTDLSEANDTAIDIIRRAALQVRLAELRPSFVVLNPIDWASIETTKDEDHRYLLVQIPTIGAQMMLWRLDVIETTAMNEGEFLVGAGSAAQVFDREEAAVEVSTEHKDYFAKNLVAIRAEERLALAVFRPESFVHGSFAE